MDLDREVFPPAERAAHAREVDPHLLRLERETRRHLVAVDVRPLRRDVDVDAALAVRNGEPGLGPEERLILLADLVDARDRHVAGRIRVAAADDERADDVRPRILAEAVARGRIGRMQRLRLGRALGIDDRLERLVLDSNGLGRTARLLRLLRRHDRDRLAEVAHAPVGQHRLVREIEPVRLLAGDVVLRQHRVHARHPRRLGRVDREHARVRVRAPDRVPPQHPRRLEVARVRELALDLRHAVVPARGRSRDAALEPAHRAGGSAHFAAAKWTASRIFW